MHVYIDCGEGQIDMLIKQALAYGNKSVTIKHFQKQVVRLAGNISKEKQALITNLLRIIVQH